LNDFTIRPGDIPHHRTGPEQDQQARLNAVRAMDRAGYTVEEMAEVLDALALLPGQEQKRNANGFNSQLVGKDRAACRPTKKEISYIPN
jgi:hypothetical protein